MGGKKEEENNKPCEQYGTLFVVNGCLGHWPTFEALDGTYFVCSSLCCSFQQLWVTSSAFPICTHTPFSLCSFFLFSSHYKVQKYATNSMFGADWLAVP